MNVTHDSKNIRLGAGEIAELFNAYNSNSASMQILSYYEEKAQDPEIKSAIKASLDASKGFNESIKNIFNSINHPIPKGFSAEDVNLKAERLFSDCFMLTYVRFMARFGLTNYAESRGSCTRSDVRDFFNQCINTTLDLLNMSDQILLSKGIYIKDPSIPLPDLIDFVGSQNFLHGFFGEKRMLNAAEISQLYFIYNRNALGKALLLGLSQTTKNKKIRDYLIRGKTISEREMEMTGSFLKKEELPIPMTLDSEITDATDTVFSDKLMLFHVVALNVLGLGTAGLSLSRVMRRDLSLALTRFMAEIAMYAEDGFNIMIENKWFERMPEAADRDALIGIK